MELNTEVESIGTGPEETVVDTGASLLVSGCVTDVDSPKVAVVDSSKATEDVDSSKVEDISGVGAEGVMGWVARREVVVEEGSNTVVLCITEK